MNAKTKQALTNEPENCNFRDNENIPATAKQKLGCLGLQRTIIKNDAMRSIFYIDESSFTRFASLALSLKMTPDELLRQIIWSSNTDDNFRKEIVLRFASL